MFSSFTLVHPSLQELQSHWARPCRLAACRVVQVAGRNRCCRLRTAGSISSGTRKQNVAALPMP